MQYHACSLNITMTWPQHLITDVIKAIKDLFYYTFDVLLHLSFIHSLQFYCVLYLRIQTNGCFSSINIHRLYSYAHWEYVLLITLLCGVVCLSVFTCACVSVCVSVYGLYSLLESDLFL